MFRSVVSMRLMPPLVSPAAVKYVIAPLSPRTMSFSAPASTTSFSVPPMTMSRPLPVVIVSLPPRSGAMVVVISSSVIGSVPI